MNASVVYAVDRLPLTPASSFGLVETGQTITLAVVIGLVVLGLGALLLLSGKARRKKDADAAQFAATLAEAESAPESHEDSQPTAEPTTEPAAEPHVAPEAPAVSEEPQAPQAADAPQQPEEPQQPNA